FPDGNSHSSPTKTAPWFERVLQLRVPLLAAKSPLPTVPLVTQKPHLSVLQVNDGISLHTDILLHHTLNMVYVCTSSS
ncbi:hypothetical protein STEG23_021706, partial [Scotinomys teguina]